MNKIDFKLIVDLPRLDYWRWRLRVHGPVCVQSINQIEKQNLISNFDNLIKQKSVESIKVQ